MNKTVQVVLGLLATAIVVPSASAYADDVRSHEDAGHAIVASGETIAPLRMTQMTNSYGMVVSLNEDQLTLEASFYLKLSYDRKTGKLSRLEGVFSPMGSGTRLTEWNPTDRGYAANIADLKNKVASFAAVVRLAPNPDAFATVQVELPYKTISFDGKSGLITQTEPTFSPMGSGARSSTWNPTDAGYAEKVNELAAYPEMLVNVIDGC